MKKVYIFITFILLLNSESFSQGYIITTPRLNFNGNQLMISYDILSKKHSDQFYIWVEMQKKSGDTMNVTALTGDIGKKINAGGNKLITWIPEKDSIFLNEEIVVEVKAEKYERSFDKSSMIFMSMALPGLGQTKMTNGKPWWLAGVAAYGSIAGGLFVYEKAQKTFDSYNSEKQDPVARAKLYDDYNKQINLCNAFIITGAAIWAANVLWVAVTPNKYLPLKHANLTVNPLFIADKRAGLFTLKLNF
jgi:hypothetical protein